MARYVERFMLLAVLWFAATVPAPGQTTLFHATGPLPSYEVATIKKADTNEPGPFVMVNGQLGRTIQSYILPAYGASFLAHDQIVGGPAWISKDIYVIQAKAPEELRLAMQKMTGDETYSQERMMQQALLADRFRLKMHYETREMPIYELTVAKGGLKIKEVPLPPPLPPSNGGPPPPPPPPGSGVRPGGIRMAQSSATTTVQARAILMSALVAALRSSGTGDNKPILDRTGFAGAFDVTDLRWANFNASPSIDADAPSLFAALEEKLGLKLTATKGMVEVIVIDSIERPSEN